MLLINSLNYNNMFQNFSVFNVIFMLSFVAACVIFYLKVKKIARNINLGKDISIKDRKSFRWKLMFRVSVFQQKMLKNPIAGVLHIMVYAGFILVNLEMADIMVDGSIGTHRFLYHALNEGGFLSFLHVGFMYPYFIGAFEIFGTCVFLACAIFIFRRWVLKIKRFWNPEMTTWPRWDATIILTTEILLMSAFLSANASDTILQTRGVGHFGEAVIGQLPVSGILVPLYSHFSTGLLLFIERFGWWFHILGVFAFLNYIPYSKHFHVFLSFPNVYYSKLEPKTKMNNMESITREVKLMLDPTAPMPDPNAPVEKFGASDIKDLTWKQLMDAFTCTECGRCTSKCPANITGKKLSPRKIEMDTRDRVEEIGCGIDKKGPDFKDDKDLFKYIDQEELWACTTCNACTEECPVNIDHPSIILDMRRYLVMEKSTAPTALNMMFKNIENNGAPWQYSPEDRLIWAQELYFENKNS